MSDDVALMGCTFEEDVRSEPIPKGKYQAVLVGLTAIDPILEGWEQRRPEDDMGIQIRADFQLMATIEGLETEYAGRYLRRQKVDLRAGVNPKTGDAYRKVAADLLRAYHNLGPKGSVKGLALFKAPPGGATREEVIAFLNTQLLEYVGLKVGISVRVYEGQDGQLRDVLGGIIVPEVS